RCATSGCRPPRATRASGAKGLALSAMRRRLRSWDRRASQRPHVYVANSSTVAERIRRFYGREPVIVPNVELKAWVPRAELARLFASAAGFVHAGEEDFGISMVEALAAGTPVLACSRGGARDIVRPGRDGFLIERPEDPAEIRRGIRRLTAREWDRGELRRRAEHFSVDSFRRRLADVIRAHGGR
ncbi:MAG: glycosyltransferase, partial [Pseudonocardiaceae bacterium]